MCVRGSWRPNRTEIYWPPLLWPSTLCLSRSPDAQPEARGSAFSTTAYQQLLWTPTHQGPKGPFGLVWPSLPHLVYNSNCLTSCLTELYNSSTTTQSLEWHVWSSSSGNNCYAVQRSLSSGASVYECIIGFFSLSHFVSQVHLRDFSSEVPSECVTSFRCITLEWQVWPGRRSKYNIRSFGECGVLLHCYYTQFFSKLVWLPLLGVLSMGQVELNCEIILFWIVGIWTVYMYKNDLALNNQQSMICHKTKPNQIRPGILSKDFDCFPNVYTRIEL